METAHGRADDLKSGRLFINRGSLGSRGALFVVNHASRASFVDGMQAALVHE